MNVLLMTMVIHAVVRQPLRIKLRLSKITGVNYKHSSAY
jgi:hypothetical protein